MLDDVLLDIEPVALSADGLEALDRLADQPEAQWYARRRRLALAAAGLLGAYNPMQPRGRDGKWIEVFGWVRWLDKKGKWKRGQVTSWSQNDGSMLVKGDDGQNRVFYKDDIPKRIFSSPTPKASLKLPDPAAHTDAPGFTKVGGQGGSNPGGLYQVTDTSLVEANIGVTPAMIKSALNADYNRDALITSVYGDDASPAELWLAGADNALIMDNKENRVFSMIGDVYWDLSTSKQVTADDIFGTPGSDRRKAMIGGHVETVETSDKFPVGDLYDVVSGAKAMAAKKPGMDAQYYVKTTKSVDHARNESLANDLYALGGVPIPDTSIGADGITFASKIVEGENVQELSQVLGDPTVTDQLKENFVFDAWLANWDVVGLNYDNVKVVDGVPYRIDAGGALSYRAQGSPKGPFFGEAVGELDTLVTPSMNQTAATTFNGITDEQIKKGVERLAAITPQDITNAVYANGLDDTMANKLIARRNFILAKYNVDEPPIDADKIQTQPPVVDVPEPAPPLPPSVPPDVQAPKVHPNDVSGMYFNGEMEGFVPGEAPGPSAITTHQAFYDPYQTINMHNVPVHALHDKYVSGFNVYVALNDGVWHLNGLIEDPIGTYKLELTHVGSGEKWQQTYPLDANDQIPMRSFLPSGDDIIGEEDFTASYASKWRLYRDHVANKYTDMKTLFHDASMGQPGTGMESVGLDGWQKGKVKVGDWVIVPPSGTQPTAYKITSIDTIPPGNNVIAAGVDLNGEPTTMIPATWSIYHGMHGSLINETLDAMQARNIVAQTKDVNDGDAPSTVVQSNTPTPTDITMQKLSASNDLQPKTPKTDADDEASKAPVTEQPEMFDPDSGVNKNLTVVGEVINVADLDTLNAQQYVGKKFYYRLVNKGAFSDEAKKKDRGVYTLEKAEEYYKDSPGYGLTLTFRDTTGRAHRKRTQGYGSGAEMFEVEGNIAPITQYSEKKDNTIVVNGMKVGTWGKEMYSYSDSTWSYPTGNYEFTLSGQYTVSGKDFTTTVKHKKDMKTFVVPMLLPPGSGGSKPKPEKVKQIQKQIVLQQIAFGSKIKETTTSGKAVTLMDGSEAKVGMWTISKTDGKIGKIVSLDTPPQAGVPGSVKVEYDDPSSPGKKMVKIRGGPTLSAAIDQDTGAVPPGSPFYDKVKLKDGSKPFPSQEVFLSGLDAMSGPVVIMGIKPDGSVRVIAPNGDKKWVKSTDLTPNKDYTKEVIVEVDADPAGVVSAAAGSYKAPKPLKPSKIPYAAPGGMTITQPSDAIAKYRQYAPARKLTKDNFVPRVGMKVRDEKGDLLVIVRQNKSFDNNPSTVYVLDPTVGGKPHAKQPTRLWVDHTSELSTWDGKPIPKIAKLHIASKDEDQDIPDGSTVYSYTESSYSYSGNRTKSIKYIVITPDGKVMQISPTYGVQNALADWQVEAVLSKNLGKVAYFDATALSTLTVEGENNSTKLWVHDSTPGALEALKIQYGQQQATTHKVTGDLPFYNTPTTPTTTPTPTPTAPTPTPTAPTPTPAPATVSGPIGPGTVTPEGILPEVFQGDPGTLVDLPKPTNAPDHNASGTPSPTPPAPQVDPVERMKAPSILGGAYSVGTGIEQLKKQMESGDPGSRSLYTMGDSDYIEDMAIRLQSVVDKKTDQDMIEVRFRLLEDKVDDLGTRLITNGGQAKMGGWDKTPLRGPKDIVPGDHISVKISTVTPPANPPEHPKDGGALKPAELNAPNATVVNAPVLVGKTPAGFDAYSIDVVTGGGIQGTIIVEQRPTPSVPTYVWNPDKIIQSSYFNASLNTEAASMGWSIRNDAAIGYESTSGVAEPDAKGRKVVDANGTSLQSTGSLQGTMRLKFDGSEGSYMTVQVTHPGAEARPPTISTGGGVSSTNAIRHSVNGEVVIRVPADDPHAVDRISAMMSAAGIPPDKQGQPTGRDLRKMALNQVFKQFNPTYTHMQRPDVTGDDDASAQSVLALIDAQVKGHMPNNRPVTMDDIELRVTPSGRMDVVLSDDVARALTARSKFKFAYHSFAHGYNPRIWTSKTETGLMSTDERYSVGILVSGGSSESDVTHDAGNRVYFRLSNTSDLKGDVAVSAMAVNKRLDNYWTPGDYWGRRQKDNTAVQYLQNSGGEFMIKRTIDPEMMSYVLIPSYQRDQRLKELKAAGITHIGGRPIEEIFVSTDNVTTDDLGELGAHYGTEIPITSIPVDNPAAPSAPVTVVATGGTMTGDIRFNTTSDYTINSVQT
jgi:hypothetical protein